MISSLAAILASTPSVILFRYTIGVLPARRNEVIFHATDTNGCNRL